MQAVRIYLKYVIKSEPNCLYLSIQGLMKNKGNMTEEMIEAYKYVFSQPGALTAPINYYRCIMKRRKEQRQSSKLIETPILIIWVCLAKCM